MNEHQTKMSFVVETNLYVNIPMPVLEYLFSIRPRISDTAFQLYVYYNFLWRNDDFQTTRSNQELAITLNTTSSTIKRANAQLISEELISRETRSIRGHCGINQTISCITRPVIPDALSEALKESPTRLGSYYEHPNKGLVGNYRDLLELLEQDETSCEESHSEQKLYTEAIRRIEQLASEGILINNNRGASTLARELTWSICHGQLAQGNFQSDSHRMNAAVALLKQGSWTVPKGFPDDYLRSLAGTCFPDFTEEEITF